MPVVSTNPAVYSVSTTPGGAQDDGAVSWTLNGHWSLNQAGYAAVLAQVAAYIASRPASAFVDNTTNAPFSINDSQGVYSCDNAHLAAQAASITAIVSNTGYLAGGN